MNSKADDILNQLNEHFDDDITDVIITVCGEELTHHEYIDGDDLTEYLHGEDMSFERRGRKIKSYGSWTETFWYSWE